MKLNITAILIFIATCGTAQNIIVKGGWQVSASTGSFLAGEDVSQVLTSTSNQIEVTVNGNVNKTSWAVNVSKSDITWNNDIEIWVRRTGIGTGSGLCYGGNVYQKVNNTSFKFIEGQRVQVAMPVQLEIRGITVTIPATAYSTNLIFTLYEY